jgi:hypothetical protein
LIRIAKIIAALVLPLLMVCAAIANRPTGLWAQLPPSNPNLGPAVTPSAPARLAQPAATAGIPPLATIPTPIPPSPAVVERIFNCSCFGAGGGTHWMGRVGAAGYFAARQGATRACLSYNQLEQVPSPFIPLSQPGAAGPIGQGVASATLPGGTQPADAAAAQVLPGVLNFSTAAQLQMCSRCTCN